MQRYLKQRVVCEIAFEICYELYDKGTHREGTCIVCEAIQWFPIHIDSTCELSPKPSHSDRSVSSYGTYMGWDDDHEDQIARIIKASIALHAMVELCRN